MSIAPRRKFNCQRNEPNVVPQLQRFQRLKVEDALAFLDKVKATFQNNPKVYNAFLDHMKDYKAQRIDTVGIIRLAGDMFSGHQELIMGFNKFLPPGYKLNAFPNGEVNIPVTRREAASNLVTSHRTGPSSAVQHPTANSARANRKFTSLKFPPGSTTDAIFKELERSFKLMERLGQFTKIYASLENISKEKKEEFARLEAQERKILKEGIRRLAKRALVEQNTRIVEEFNKILVEKLNKKLDDFPSKMTN